MSWGDREGTGLVSVEFTFTGQTAHSAGAPWRGRSALDAVELMNIGWNYRREHLPLEHRSHYVVTNGGDQPNVVPRNASVWYYFRQTTYPKIKELWGIGESIAKGAAMMTNTELQPMRVLGSAWPQHFNKVVAETTWANIQKVGMPEWSEADQTLAKALQKELGGNQQGLSLKIGAELQGPVRDNRGGGSDDIGDISWNVPTVTLRFPSNIPGLPGHNWANAISMATPIAHKGATAGAKVQAMTILDLVLEARARRPGVGLLQERADQGHQVRAAHPSRGQAGDRDEQGHHGQVPARAEEVLLRSVALQDLPRAAGDHLSDGEALINLDGLEMRVSSTAANGVVGSGTRLHFVQRGDRVAARYSGGAVARGWLAGRVTGSELVFRYAQREQSGAIHGGRSVCQVERLGNGRTRIVEHFTWRTRSGSGINVFDECASRGRR